MTRRRTLRLRQLLAALEPGETAEVLREFRTQAAAVAEAVEAAARPAQRCSAKQYAVTALDADENENPNIPHSSPLLIHAFVMKTSGEDRTRSFPNWCCLQVSARGRRVARQLSTVPPGRSRQLARRPRQGLPPRWPTSRGQVHVALGLCSAEVFYCVIAPL